MALRREDLLERYPEEYLLEEDEMGESNSQYQLAIYLVDVLKWYYQEQNWLVTGNLELHHPAIQNSKHKIIPDVVVFKDIELTEEVQADLTSWKINQRHPAPPVIFEISSASTWGNDIEEGEKRKPEIYGRIGVQEYFAYDPNPTPVWQNQEGRRLLGWRYVWNNPTPQPLLSDERGRLWSEVLESWLVPDGAYLRLYDREGQLRLTGREAERAGREAERVGREAERQRANAEKQRADKLAELLRRYNLDPDNLP